MIIPPKLKILAGFAADQDVTIEQIIEALEKRNLRQPAKSISNEKVCSDPTRYLRERDPRSRQHKFLQLTNERQARFTTETYEEAFAAVCASDEGLALINQMQRSHSSVSDSRSKDAAAISDGGHGEFKSKEAAQETFLRHVAELTSKGLSRDQAWTTSAATEPGASAYYAWKLLAAAETPKVVAIPAYAHGPSEAEIDAKRKAMGT